MLFSGVVRNQAGLNMPFAAAAGGLVICRYPHLKHYLFANAIEIRGDFGIKKLNHCIHEWLKRTCNNCHIRFGLNTYPHFKRGAFKGGNLEVTVYQVLFSLVGVIGVHTPNYIT